MTFSSARLFLRVVGALLAILGIFNVARAQQTVTFDTTPYWPEVEGIVGGLGPDVPTTTMGETFVAPSGGSVFLNDFTFYGQSYYPYNGGIATLYLQAFVFQWSGNGATGIPLYLGPAFIYSPQPRPNGWTPLTVDFGAGISGVALVPDDVYVMGVTLSNPVNYAASSGDIEFQDIPGITFPESANGGGGACNLNNGDDFAALTTSPWGGGAALSFTADLTVVPEPSGISLLLLGGFLCFIGRRILQAI